MSYYDELKQTYLSVSPKKGKEEIKSKDDAAQFVEQRFNTMSIAKMKVREKWNGIQALYYDNSWEWIVRGDEFDQPIRFPTLRDVTMSLTDNFVQNPPAWLLKPKNEDEDQLVIGKKAYLDQWRNSLQEKRVRRQVINDMFFYGKGFRYVSWFDIKKQYNDEVVDIMSGLASIRIDPRNIFFDENATKVHDQTGTEGARDMIMRTVMPFSSYSYYAKRYGFKADVQPESWYTSGGLDFLVTNETELLEKSPVQVVKLYEYMNHEENLYVVVANKQTVYEGKLLKDKGTYCLPIADYSYENRNDSIWGISLGELIAPHIYAKDTLFNLELMNLKYTLQPVLAVSGEFGYNKNIHVVQPGGVWQASGQLNGKIGDNIQPIIIGNPNTKVYDMLNTISSELTITTRSDLRSLEDYTNKTATEVITQSKSMNVHNEVIENINEIEAETKMAELACQIMKAFMDEKDENGRRKRVEAKGYIVTKNDTDTPEFINKSGFNDFFELTKQMIDVDAEIEIQDKRSEVAKNVEKLGRIMQAVPMIGNLAQLDPNVLKRLDVFGLIEQLVEAVGLDVDRSLLEEEGESNDEFEMMKEEILFGHNVDIPEDESRKDSMARLKYLNALRKKLGKEITTEQLRAWTYTLTATISNIATDQIKKQKMKKEQEKAQMMQQMIGQQGGQQALNVAGQMNVAQPQQQPSNGVLGKENLTPNV